MAAEHSDTAIESYIELELRLRDFLRVVPFEPVHQKVYSPVLASLLLDCCSLIESILKSTMDNARYDGIHNIAQHRARRYATTVPFLNINDLRATFRPDQFYAKRVWFLSRGDPSLPWRPWCFTAGNPKWWTAYNRVKHARFDNAPQAKLGITVHAMKALFLVLVQSLEFRARLVERGIIRARGLPIPALLAAVANWETLPTPHIVVAVSDLFGYKFLSQGSPAQAPDASLFL
jgi:hypothetical protein